MAPVDTELRLHRALLNSILAVVDRIEGQGVEMAKKFADYVSEMQAEMAKLSADVAEQTTLVQSVKVFIEGLAAQNAALKAQIQELIDNGGDPAQLQPLIDTLNAQDAARDANAKVLADAMVANTEPPA